MISSKQFDLHTLIVVAVAFWFLNGNINTSIEKVVLRLDLLEKDVAVIKTVLLLKKLYSKELVKCEGEK